MSCGVYIIKNTSNDKCYVGSAVNFRKRWILHKCLLRNGAHHSPHLQNAWNKHGEEAFEFEILEVTTREVAVKVEQEWIDKLSPAYNMSPTAGSSLGTHHTDEAKAKIAAGRMGKRHTDEAKAKMSAANLGRKHTPESRERNRLAQLGKHHIPHTDESKAKMSISARLRPRRTHSAETKAKMAASQKGRVFSEETKAKMSAAAQLRMAREPRVRDERGIFIPIAANA